MCAHTHIHICMCLCVVYTNVHTLVIVLSVCSDSVYCAMCLVI